MKNVSPAQRPFLITLICCVQFVLVTFVAMLLYPGGTAVDSTTTGYTFINNFFSDLGMTVAHNEQTNMFSAVLFFLSLTIAGIGLITYFVAIPNYFKVTRGQRTLSLIGSFFGVLSGLAYIGIAFTPANLALQAHIFFVQAAFGTFLVAVLFYIPAVFFNGEISNAYTVAYAIFAICLSAYLWLIFSGLSGPEALLIQVVGQKLIVYAAIICMAIQAYGAYQLATEVKTAVPAMAD